MAAISALFFDVDGTIVDTEKDGHRVAFNATFKEFGFDCAWDVDTYHELLQVAGGKERMRRYFQNSGLFQGPIPDQLIEALHQRKTEIFIGLIENRQLPLRAGVKRLMAEALEGGLRLGICTTANERAVNAIIQAVLPGVPFDVVLAGDVIRKKKPDPEIYLLALEKTGLRPGACIVIEDSSNGVRAAKSAGMFVVATTNGYTEREDLSAADIIVTSLGDPDGEKGLLKKAEGLLDFSGCLHLNALITYFSMQKPAGPATKGNRST
jgi:HAD superfamily hydrolase (TIGR01509 family)